MKKRETMTTDENWTFARREPDWQAGLTGEEAAARAACGAHNRAPEGVTPSVKKIVLKNVCTLFNLINFLLALAVVLVGHPKNALFFGIAVCNTVMGIVQELRAKRTLDKLSILARGQAAVVRDGQPCSIGQEDVVIDDIMLLVAGDQVCADGVVVAVDGLEVDEALLTGEADHIKKQLGDVVLSGSFITAGQAHVRVTAVGQASYAGTLALEAKKVKKANTPLMRTLNNIIRVLAIAIIPIGLLLFFTQYTGRGDLDVAVLGSTAGMIGMIPEGLILLTGVTLTVGALKLAQRKALVQSLYSIETLARVDVLCLDKTGTITDGTLSFEEIVLMEDWTTEVAEEAIKEMMGELSDANATAVALRAVFGGQAAWRAVRTVPFSSRRKWSAAEFEEKGSYVLGAPGFVLQQGELPVMRTVEQYAAKGYRVLCLAHSKNALPEEGLPEGLECVALVVLADTIRAEAADTFKFFADEGVTLKVISGDDALTVSTIAAKAGIAGAENFIDLSTLPEGADYGELAEQYTVFGRVAPEQKKALIDALKQAGHTTCMTGDGVNDVLAMKEADCSVAMINGSEAARAACDFVLMTGDFSVMVDVLREGRRVINNIENVACMYLVKTIYSTVLSLLYAAIPYPYPFAPLQMTPINTLTVGIPSFFLALRPDYDKPRGKFVHNILENSLPAALTVIFNILVVQLAGVLFGLTQADTSTMNVLLTGAVGFRLLYRVAVPLKTFEKALIAVLVAAFLAIFLFFGDFFDLESLFTRNVFFYLPLLYTSMRMVPFLAKVVGKLREGVEAFRRRPEEAGPDGGGTA